MNLRRFKNQLFFQAHFFDRDDVALKNVSKYFMENSDEEREHANKLIHFHNQRGGTTKYEAVKVHLFRIDIR